MVNKIISVLYPRSTNIHRVIGLISTAVILLLLEVIVVCVCFHVRLWVKPAFIGTDDWIIAFKFYRRISQTLTSGPINSILIVLVALWRMACLFVKVFVCGLEFNGDHSCLRRSGSCYELLPLILLATLPFSLCLTR